MEQLWFWVQFPVGRTTFTQPSILSGLVKWVAINTELGDHCRILRR